jgi:hypothetical protein
MALKMGGGDLGCKLGPVMPPLQTDGQGLDGSGLAALFVENQAPPPRQFGENRI